LKDLSVATTIVPVVDEVVMDPIPPGLLMRENATTPVVLEDSVAVARETHLPLQ